MYLGVELLGPRISVQFSDKCQAGFHSSYTIPFPSLMYEVTDIIHAAVHLQFANFSACSSIKSKIGRYPNE